MLEDTDRALAVSRDILELSADALLSGDFDGFAKLTAFPYTLDTETSRRVCDTRDELRTVFDGVHQHLRQMDITLMDRNCLAATFEGPLTIIAAYETRLISNGLMVEEPFPCLMHLNQGGDGIWRVHESSYPSSDGSGYRSALAR